MNNNFTLAIIFVLTMLLFCGILIIVKAIKEVNEDEKKIKRYRRNK